MGFTSARFGVWLVVYFDVELNTKHAVAIFMGSKGQRNKQSI